MKSSICPNCGAQMKRNGKTKTGAQRWRCKECGGSKTHRINNDAKQLEAFLAWLFSSKKQMDMPGQGRSFRRIASISSGNSGHYLSLLMRSTELYLWVGFISLET